MKKRMYLAVIVLSVAIAGFTQGSGMGDMALENTLLRQRLDQLDREIQALRDNSSLRGAETQERRPLWSNLDIQFYGFLKLDAAYDSSRTDTGNFARWVNSEYPNNKDEQFNMTANETRLGFNITGPKSNGMVTSGKVEIDFYGTGAAENKAGIMMRHAFITLNWPDDKFSIIAGQTSDVISPLVPSTLNYSVCWWVGNLGYRRPQIRLTKEFNLDNNIDLKLEGAISRTIGRYDPDSDITWDTDSGADAGFPTLQGRIGVTMPICSERLTTIGLSGHKGTEEYDILPSGTNTKFESWSVNMDVTQPVCEKLSVKGELFTGKNLDSYLGGIGQGVTLSGANMYDEVRSSGGWIAASIGPWSDVAYNVGLSMEEVDRGTVNTGGKLLNRTIFGNMVYSLNKQTDVGLELSHWRTEYKGSGDADSVRLQAALKYKF